MALSRSILSKVCEFDEYIAQSFALTHKFGHVKSNFRFSPSWIPRSESRSRWQSNQRHLLWRFTRTSDRVSSYVGHATALKPFIATFPDL